jgi:hypothetical protein
MFRLIRKWLWRAKVWHQRGKVPNSCVYGLLPCHERSARLTIVLTHRSSRSTTLPSLVQLRYLLHQLRQIPHKLCDLRATVFLHLRFGGSQTEVCGGFQRFGLLLFKRFDLGFDPLNGVVNFRRRTRHHNAFMLPNVLTFPRCSHLFTLSDSPSFRLVLGTCEKLCNVIDHCYSVRTGNPVDHW